MSKIKKTELDLGVKIINQLEQLWRNEKESAEAKLKQYENVIIVTKAWIEFATKKLEEAEKTRD